MKKLLSTLLVIVALVAMMGVLAVTASADSPTVYVGNVLMTEGTYLANGKTSTQTTKPSGGYAYLSGSTLTLNNYSYTGAGTLIGGGADCYSAIYANGALDIVLTGSNTLNMDDTATSYAIYTMGMLTIKKDTSGGSLTIKNCTRGIESSNNVLISSGSVAIDAAEYGIYSGAIYSIAGANLTITSATDGIYAKQAALILGGKTAIEVQGVGINTGGSYGQSSGRVSIETTSIGIVAISNVTLTNGELYVTSDSHAIGAPLGDVAISGGFFDIKSTTVRALVGKTVTFKNMAPKASTTKDGSLTDYVAANIANYKRIAYLADVYVGGVGLANGQYLATGSASATTTKPSGGYAYYKDGVLTLNNYTYDGAGYSVPENSGYTALVYSEKALTVKLAGNNTLVDSINSYGVGIWIENEALAIIDGGSGALNITVKDDGIYTDDDDINIQSGAITITAGDFGIYSRSNLTISGGTVDVDSGDDSIYAYDNVDISGGTVNVDSGDDGIYASNGDMTISGGKVTINSGDDGIYADDNVDISGGTITITADYSGIYAYFGSVTISGGELDVTGDNLAIGADNIVLDGVTLQASTTKDGTLVDYVATNRDTYKRVVSKVFVPDIYVGAVGLANGQYLATGSASATTTKPSGGYAYYKDGTLTLNNYTYDGAGCSVPESASYTALVYSEKALTVKLVGTNTLTNSIDSKVVGIWVHKKALTIIDGGSGALNITVKDDGIFADDDDIDIQGGAITVTAGDYGIYSNSKLTISGGTINIDSGDDGIFANDNATISGGTVNVDSDDYGICSYGNITISGGELDITSDGRAIACDDIVLDGVTLQASTTKDGTLVDYVAANRDTYKRVVTPCGHVYDNACDKTCNRCGATRTPSAHKGGTATCKVKAKCSVCGESYGSLKSHSYEKKITKATLTKDGIIKNVCKTCGYTASKTTTIYKASSVKLSKTSYTYNGKVQKPSVVVKDSKGNTISSSHYTVTYPSGMKNAGTYKVKITFKGNYSGTKTLSYTIKPIDISKCKITLSTTSYTYNGSVKKPAVTVKNASGTKLTTSSYTVTYASGRKNVGKYKVTIKMKGNYSGTKTLYFKINPPKTTVKSLTAGSKKLTVNITKKSTQVTGYQIQYSTSKSFKSYKTKTVSSYKTTKTTLTGLKAKTTYYVRVRTYKTVNGTKYYSGWSTYKYMKTK